jgi:hypothetical protein
MEALATAVCLLAPPPRLTCHLVLTNRKYSRTYFALPPIKPPLELSHTWILWICLKLPGGFPPALIFTMPVPLFLDLS